MARIGFIYHDKFLDHETGHSHPENRHRLTQVYDHVREAELDEKIDWIVAESTTEEMLLLNHDTDHIEYIRKTCENHSSAVLDDGDTRVCSASFNVALLAVGASIQGIDLLHSGKYKRIFVAARPPGHHALFNRAMGFCLFNNVAIAAKYAITHYGYERIMILDWDVHHGNGTQDSFYKDPRVLFCSIHQFPFYPGTGSALEKGEAEGANLTLNIPLEAGAEMEQYRNVMLNIVIPTAAAYKPQLLIVSAGFDAHCLDPLANINLGDEDYHELSRLTVSLCEKHCEGKLLSVLEGGYHRDALSRSVIQHLMALSESDPETGE
jgi:acetoin utilization deacetylase AcuC-like enzyme